MAPLRCATAAQRISTMLRGCEYIPFWLLQCIPLRRRLIRDDPQSDPFDSPFVMPSNGRWFGVESKSHNTPGSYITAAKLREAEVDFDEEESIKLQCRPPKHLRGSFALRDPSQGRSSHCLTLFNIVSKEEADHIGMTNFDILYGADFDHDIHQQYKAERVDPQLVPPRAPWPPNHRPATPSESAESIDSRLERRPARHETQRVSAGYTMTYRAPDGGQLSLTAPESTTDFMGKVQGILPIIAAGPSLLSPSPMMIQSAAAIRDSRNISNRGTESHYPVSHVARSVAASVHTGFEHGHKRKATEDVAPAPSERRQQWADEPSGYRDQ